MPKCEDYPCCGHTSQDPCERQDYDEPGHYDTTIPGHEHNLCNHAEDECLVEPVDFPDDDEDDDLFGEDPFDEEDYSAPILAD